MVETIEDINDVHFYEMKHLKKMEVKIIGHSSICKEITDEKIRICQFS